MSPDTPWMSVKSWEINQINKPLSGPTKKPTLAANKNAVSWLSLIKRRGDEQHGYIRHPQEDWKNHSRAPSSELEDAASEEYGWTYGICHLEFSRP